MMLQMQNRLHACIANFLVTMDLIVDFPQRRPAAAAIEGDARPRVRFAPNLEITIVENLSREHKFDLWFTDVEIKSFKRRTAAVLLSIHFANMTVAQFAEINCRETSAFLGLENYMSERTSREIRRRRNGVRDAVLFEQARQQDAGVNDPEVISLTSKRVTLPGRKRAYVIGLIHASPRRSDEESATTTLLTSRRMSESEAWHTSGIDS